MQCVSALESDDAVLRVIQVTEVRKQEWDEMKQYMNTTDRCLMTQLRRGLGDVTLTGNDVSDACGKCSNCRSRPVVTSTYNRQLADRAVQHLKTSRKVEVTGNLTVFSCEWIRPTLGPV